MLSHAVAQRTREIGVRMALGAQLSDVLVASMALTRTIKNLLFGISASDPLTFAAIALLLVLVALLACFIPPSCERDKYMNTTSPIC
jgi:putative ABC transport system permease protein